jgi:hypothetical protein
MDHHIVVGHLGWNCSGLREAMDVVVDDNVGAMDY